MEKRCVCIVLRRAGDRCGGTPPNTCEFHVLLPAYLFVNPSVTSTFGFVSALEITSGKYFIWSDVTVLCVYVCAQDIITYQTSVVFRCRANQSTSMNKGATMCLHHTVQIKKG